MEQKNAPFLACAFLLSSLSLFFLPPMGRKRAGNLSEKCTRNENYKITRCELWMMEDPRSGGGCSSGKRRELTFSNGFHGFFRSFHPGCHCFSRIFRNTDSDEEKNRIFLAPQAWFPACASRLAP